MHQKRITLSAKYILYFLALLGFAMMYKLLVGFTFTTDNADYMDVPMSLLPQKQLEIEGFFFRKSYRVDRGTLVFSNNHGRLYLLAAEAPAAVYTSRKSLSSPIYAPALLEDDRIICLSFDSASLVALEPPDYDATVWSIAVDAEPLSQIVCNDSGSAAIVVGKPGVYASLLTFNRDGMLWHTDTSSMYTLGTNPLFLDDGTTILSIGLGDIAEIWHYDLNGKLLNTTTVNIDSDDSVHDLIYIKEEELIVVVSTLALDAFNIKLNRLWRYDRSGQVPDYIDSVIDLGNGSILFKSNEGTAECIDYHGKALWKLSLDEKNIGELSKIGDDNWMYVANDRIHFYSNSGANVGQYEIPIVEQQYLTMGPIAINSHLIALPLLTGKGRNATASLQFINASY